MGETFSPLPISALPQLRNLFDQLAEWQAPGTQADSMRSTARALRKLLTNPNTLAAQLLEMAGEYNVSERSQNAKLHSVAQGLRSWCIATSEFPMGMSLSTFTSWISHVLSQTDEIPF